MALDDNCLNCIYYGMSIRNCDYFEIEGKLRGCPGGDKCSKKVEKSKRKKRNTKSFVINIYPEERRLRNKENSDRRLKLWEDGMTDAEIANAEGMSLKGVAGWRRGMGLTANHKKKRNVYDEQYGKIMLALYEFGRTDEEIARAVGIKKLHVKEWRDFRGLEANKY